MCTPDQLDVKCPTKFSPKKTKTTLTFAREWVVLHMWQRKAIAERLSGFGLAIAMAPSHDPEKKSPFFGIKCFARSIVVGRSAKPLLKHGTIFYGYVFFFAPNDRFNADKSSLLLLARRVSRPLMEFGNHLGDKTYCQATQGTSN